MKAISRVERGEGKYFEGSASWKNGSSISVAIFTDYMIAAYSADDEPIRDHLYFTRVPNNYGGADRVYFYCPDCGRRSRFLYCHRKRFKCRICAGLNYRSQQVTRGVDMAVHRLRNLLREKFKDDAADMSPCELECYVPPKPKGMHQRTYDRLVDELERLQDESQYQFALKMIAIIKRAGVPFEI